MKKIFALLFFALSLQAISISNGEVALLQFDKKVTIKIDGKDIRVLQNPSNKKRFYALIPINYRSQTKTKTVLVDNKKIELDIQKGKYKIEQIRVDKSKVSPNKKALLQIHQEYKEAYKIYDKFNPLRYWNKPFVLPINSHITSAYGNARIFNGVLQSFHTGVDFRAKIGTKIRAVNDGVVMIAKKRYYAGNSVIIDHGEGVYSCYYHLSHIRVHVGEMVKQNQIIGVSGESGRVSGPHLHFEIKLYGMPINPLQFEKQINSILGSK